MAKLKIGTLATCTYGPVIIYNNSGFSFRIVYTGTETVHSILVVALKKKLRERWADVIVVTDKDFLRGFMLESHLQ